MRIDSHDPAVHARRMGEYLAMVELECKITRLAIYDQSDGLFTTLPIEFEMLTVLHELVAFLNSVAVWVQYLFRHQSYNARTRKKQFPNLVSQLAR